MNGGTNSWTRSLVIFAAAVLLVGWAINRAARLLLDVWPVLLIVAVLVLGLVILVRFLRYRDHW